MQNPLLSSVDAVNQHHKQVALSQTDMRNITKTENKPTETVNALSKTEKSIINDKQIKNKDTIDKTIDKTLKENIVKEKLLESRSKESLKKPSEDFNKIANSYKPSATEEKQQTASLDGLKNETALEVAVKQQDVLESVKSVKPDGTETYYFPVPVEILTQLPPPGNLGISAKMLEDIIEKSAQDKVTDNQEIKLQAAKDNTEKITNEKIETKEQTQTLEAEKYNTQKATQSDNKQALQTIFN